MTRDDTSTRSAVGAAAGLAGLAGRSLGAQLRRRFLLLGVLPVVAVFAATWALLLPVLVDQAEARNRELALAVRDQVALQLDLRLHAGAVLADGIAGLAPASAAQRNALGALLRGDRFVQGVFAVDARGRIVEAALADAGGRYADDTIGLDLTGQPHVALARAQRSPVWSDAFLSTMTGELTAALALPSGDGLVVIELSLAALSRSVTELAQAGGTQVVIVDRAGRVIAHPDARQALQQVSLHGLAPVRAALAGTGDSARVVRDGVDELVHALPVAPIGWAVIVSQPVSAVMAPLRRLGGAVAGLLGLTVIVAVVVGWRMARNTGSEVALLADGAQRIVQQGAPPALRFSTDEFNAVWTRLRDLFRELGERDEQTRAAQRDLQAVLDAATQVAIVATDPAGLVTVFNIGAQRMLGWRASEVVGRLTPIVWHDAEEVAERAAALGRHHGMAIDGFEVLVVEPRHSGYEVRDWRFVTRDGGRVDVSLAVTAMRGPDGALKGFLLVAVDITERRRAELLEVARRTAEASSRAKSEFLSRMSHELRTPLNAILGYAQLLDVDPEMPVVPRQHERLQHIQRAGWHLVRLIEDVLDLARIEAGGLRVAIVPVPLAPVFEQVAQIVQPQLQRHGVTLSTELGDAALRAAADETRLVQVLVNLVGNAAKYNRTHGTVQLAARSEGGRVRLTVADTGPGMTPEQLGHLFEPFNRLGRERSGVEGTGIGLVITRHLVGLMHGTIDVRSEPGVGTTIDVTLPAAGTVGPEAPAGGVAAAGGAAAAAAPPTRGRVLYIEDNEINIQLMRAILRQRPDVALEVCADAASGLAAARRAPPDLVLLDIHLPDASGEEVLAALRGDPRTARLPVVVVSADATQAQIARMRERGAHDYLTKPLDVSATLRVVDETLAAAARAAEGVAD